MSNREGTFDQVGRSPLSFLEGWTRKATDWIQHWLSDQHRVTRRVMVSAILVLALLAFELFNFDTTEFALEDLLGPTSFAGVRWATILAVAFCSIDFAGLARLITPEALPGAGAGGRVLKPSWLLLGAWLLGGGMNAVMTWWAVSLALMGHSLGNEVLTREQLLQVVPIFVAVLVWLTRILIISSFTMNSDRVAAASTGRRSTPAPRPRNHAVRPDAAPKVQRPRPAPKPVPASAAPPQPEPAYVGVDEKEGITRPNGKPTPRRGGSRRPQGNRPPRGTRPSTTPVRLRSQDKSGRRKV